MHHVNRSPSLSAKGLATLGRASALALLIGLPTLGIGCSGSSGGGGGDDSGGGSGGSNGGSSGGKSGNAAGNSGGSNGGSSGGSNGGSSGGSGGVVMAPPDVKACGPLPPAPVRRLSKVDYVGSIREIFPFAFPPDADGVYRIDNHSLSLMRGAQTVSWNWKDDVPLEPATYGFLNRANNLNPSSFVLESYDDNAVVIAEFVSQAKFLPMLLPCQDKTVDCGKKFIDSYGPKFFRRPLSDDEKKAYYDYFQQQFDGAKTDNAQADGFTVALRLTLEVLLQAPQFLYRLEVGDPATKKDGAIRLTQYEIASRLSYSLWSTGPDQMLLDAAAKNELSTAEQLETQARRMLKDKRFRFMIIEYFRQWADLERIFSEGYRRKPGYSLGDTRHPYPIWYALAARHEVEAFVEWVFADSDGTFNTLFTSTKSSASSYTKALYTGVRIADNAENPDFVYADYQVPADQRAGLLTRAFFGWAYSHFDTPNPPLRGSFMLSKVFCEHFPPPPADAQTLAGSVNPPAGATNREQFVARIAVAPICKSCHNTLDPLGFSMENYDEVGMYMKNDAKNPAKVIDASGSVSLPNKTDIDGPFTNAVDLSKKIGKSKSAAACMTQQWYEYLVGRDATGVVSPAPEDGVDKCRIQGMVDAMNAKNGDVRESMVAWIKSPDFQWRPAY